MAYSSPNAQDIELASDSDQVEIDWSRAVSPYVPRNIDPCLPSNDADLIDVQPPKSLQGRLESWDEVQQRYQSYALCGMDLSANNPYRGIDDSTKLVLGALALPGGLVRGTCKRLFGDYPEVVTTWQLHAIAHALFNPHKNFWGNDGWRDVCRRADLVSRRRAAITDQVKELIRLGEVD